MLRNPLLLTIGAAMILCLAGCGVSSPSPAGTDIAPPALPSATPSPTPEKPDRSLYLPVGRSAVAGRNAFQVLIDSEPYDPQPESDGYGGYWIEVPFNSKLNTAVTLRFTVNGGSQGLYREPDPDRHKWLQPSALVDSNDPALVAKAQELTAGGGTAMERARIVHTFVIGYLKFQPYGRHFLAAASETFRLGYGTCVNYARLFVALSRAAGVPARTVWGAALNNGAYEHHHEWAEYLDDDGYWHPLDLSYTTSFELADVNYLDLICSSEENPLYEQSRTEEYRPDQTRFIVYDTTPDPYDGRLGFTFVKNNFPNSYVVENVFLLSKLPEMVPQQVP
jgi:hypothetical protein